MKSAFYPFVCIIVLTGTLRSQELVLDNPGLKNTYRLVFEEISPKQQFVRGALEILGDASERKTAHTRIPFSGTLSSSEADANVERLELSPATLVSFFPPADKNEGPAVSGWFYGRKTKSPGVSLELWDFGKEGWAPFTMSFGSVPEAVAAENWLSAESIDGISLGMTEKTVREKAGTRIFKSEAHEEGATGLTVQDWMLPDLGMELHMGKVPDRDESYTVGSITVTAKSKSRTARGIGIGDTRAAVLEKYGKLINKEESEAAGDDALVAGSIYEGLFFFFDKSGKVNRIFLGAGAE